MDDRFKTISTVPKEDSSAGAKFQQGPVERIGRYRIERPLGQGGFGFVYLAHDEQLNRAVAVKVPHPRRILRPEDAELYLREARTVAKLDHPNIVPVFDVGSTESFACFIVSKYIDGSDLGARLKEGPPPLAEAVELTATVAEALHHAHKHRLVHRDIKPGNILLDINGQAYVTDFGLAVQDQDFGKEPCYAGTPAYMSPEQARGEGHRIDGRSDIFSLGVVLYELMVGARPFKADTVKELLEVIDHVEVRPPRQLKDEVPKELERICLKALAKKATERYSTAKDLSDDLRHWIDKQSGGRGAPKSKLKPTRRVQSAESPAVPADAGGDPGKMATPGGPASETVKPSSDNRPLRIVPKGLRSFDAHDAEFFLELLPGPRDRDGLPDSIRFWKTRVQETDADATFSVGVNYGPSGCGKSSLVKAGLLPRLSQDVIAIYIEATADETEARLLYGLRKRCPAMPTNLGLQETLAVLRRGHELPEGKKVLIVIDQFEQWLHAKREPENTELVQALRQCDGGRVQCIVMVRDDFWMATTRFMRELEIRIVEGQNSAVVDLFPVRHAHEVLSAFGRAVGALPEPLGETSSDQKQFVQQAVSGLAEDGKVICIRLALFAEMMKNKSWTPATLEAVGGAEGVGVAFLEETFSAAAAPPEHRFYQKAARAVLKALLPESGADIKGNMRSHAELLAASGLAAHLKDFDVLVRILDGELRLITPTDPDGQVGPDDSDSTPKTGEKYYQLTHDYLVRSLREWLTRKQRETRRGRAELILAERSALWSAKPENRSLPSLGESVRIGLLTNRRHWSEPQRRMMAKAGRVRGIQAAVATMLLIVVGTAGVMIRNGVVEREHAAEALVDGLLTADIAQVPAKIDVLKEYRAWADPLLETKFKRAAEGSPEQLNAALALLPEDESKVNYLLGRLFLATPEQFRVVFDALLPYKDKLIRLAQDELADRPAEDASEDEKETVARRKAIAAVTLLRCGIPEDVWPLLKQTPDPRVRSYIIHWLGPLGGDPRPIISRWEHEPDVTIRRALILMLGEFTDAQLSAAERQPLIEKLLAAFENEPDPGLHTAAEWLLRKWGQADRLQGAIEKLRPKESPLPTQPATDKRQWFVNSQGQTFVVLDAGEFMMGSPESDPDRRVDEMQHLVHIGRRIAICASHVTKAQYKKFQRAVNGFDLAGKPELSDIVTSDDSPQTGVTWFEAAQYCNWLSKQEGLPECYEPIQRGENPGDFGPRMKGKDKYLELSSYRLPTEAEWEFACRAGTVTSRYYGLSKTLLPHYAWYAANGHDQTWPVASLKPNDFGLFDMLGDALEWCDDLGSPEPASNSDIATRVVRGGAYNSDARIIRSAWRNRSAPEKRSGSIGFRPARTYP